MVRRSKLHKRKKASRVGRRRKAKNCRTPPNPLELTIGYIEDAGHEEKPQRRLNWNRSLDA
jgi:hypothetical protein